MLPALLEKEPLVGQRPVGSALALAEVYRLHAQTVARWAQRLGGPTVDAEDVVQEVFLAVHQKLSGFRGDASLTTWLYRITENVVRYRRRKDRVRRWLGGSAEDVAGSVPSGERSPAEVAASVEGTRRVYRVLDGMKEKYRNVLILFELEELSGEEIAALTGTKLATVWVWLHRARLDFAKRLEAQDREEAAR